LRLKDERLLELVDDLPLVGLVDPVLQEGLDVGVGGLEPGIVGLGEGCTVTLFIRHIVLNFHL